MSDMSEALALTQKLFYDDTGMDRGRVQAIIDRELDDAPEGEAYFERTSTQSVSISESKIKARSQILQGVGLRRTTLDGNTAYTSTSTLTEEAISTLTKSLSVIRGEEEGALSIPRDIPAPGRVKSLYTFDNPILAMTPARKAEMLKQVDQYLREKDPRVTQVDATLLTEYQCVEIVRPGRPPVADSRPLIRMNVSVVVKENGVTETARSSGGGRVKCSTVFNERTLKRAADRALKDALTLLRATPAPAGEMTVVLGNAWAGILLHEAVGHGLEADAIRHGESLFKDYFGKQVAAKGVTVVDDGTIANRRGTLNVDDEGNPTQRNVLIEDGTMVACLTDEMNARLLGVPKTGSGRRESYEYAPMPRMNNTFALKGNDTPSNIYKSVMEGLRMPDFSNGQVDPISGKFNFNATLVYPIQNGKTRWSQPMKGAAATGDCVTIMKQITMIGNDLKLDSGVGTCGKEGQSVPVGLGQPTLRIDGLTVGGRD